MFAWVVVVVVVVVAGVDGLACLVSIKHSETCGKWARFDGPWFGPSDGLKALARLAVLHAVGLYVCRRWRVQCVPSYKIT